MVDDDRDQEPGPDQSPKHYGGKGNYSPHDHGKFILDLMGIPVGKISGE